MDRLETIEETAELVEKAGGKGIAVRVDHTVPEEVRSLVDRIEREQGRLDVLVNDVWGGDRYIEWTSKVWEFNLEYGLRMLHNAVDSHIITSHFALKLLIRNPGGLLVEITDGTREVNDENYRMTLFYDLSKTTLTRMAWGLAKELEPHECTAVSVSPGWLRSEQMLDNYKVKEENWHDAVKIQPHFAITETPRYVGRAVAALAADPNVARWNGQSLSSGQLAKEYGFTDLDGSQPDAWRYMVEVQLPGKPADVTGYR
jgi:NAD(P)-dependent dehydrogenase (short-subunit alcohol dehydrogenase family)